MSYQLLAPPPLNNQITSDEKVSVPYQKYFTNINAAISATLSPTNFTSSITGVVATGPVLMFPDYATTEIDSMTPADGAAVYDSTLNVFKIRQAGVWKEIATV